jgi:hypothetical protein
MLVFLQTVLQDAWFNHQGWQMSFGFGDAGYVECDAVLLDDSCPLPGEVPFHLQGLRVQEE